MQDLLFTQDSLTKIITDNATVALFMMNEKGYCTFMNPAAELMTGFTFEEIKQKPLHYMIHHTHPDGSHYPMEDCPIDRALPENFDVRAHEDLFIRKDGSFYPVSCAASPIFENGRPVSTIIEVRDLTLQKQAESMILRKNASLQILNNIAKSISEELNLQNIIQKVTDSTTRLVGAQFGAFFYNVVGDDGGKYTLFTLSGASRDQFEKFGMPRNTAVFHNTFSGAGALRVDDITQHPHYGKMAPHFGMPAGHLPVLSYLAIPVISSTGDVLGGLFFGHEDRAVFTAEDEEMAVSVASQAAIAIDNAMLFEKLKKANDHNASLLQLAEELNEKKDEFLSIASHELKTPLTTIKAYNSLMKQEYFTSQAVNESFLQKTEMQIAKLERLIGDLLDVSKITSGHLQYQFQEFDLSHAIKDSVAAVEFVTRQCNISVIANPSALIYGDRVRIEQVITNLLANGIKYSPGAKDISISLHLTHLHAVVNITDKGIGIAREHLEKIFKRFYRIQESSNQFGGMGLGLFISYQIIQAHKGTIWVDSELNKGSVFSFSLPLAQPVLLDEERADEMPIS